jgi:hypothetical protein
MKTNRPLLTPDDDKNIVKKILLFSCAGTLVFCAISSSPHWTLRLMVSAAALLAMIYELSRNAPLGYEDQAGFHYVRVRKPRRRTLTKRMLTGWLFPAPRRPVRA